MKRFTQGWYVVCLATLIIWVPGEVQAQLAANRKHDRHANARRGQRPQKHEAASALEAELASYLDEDDYYPPRPDRRESDWDESPLKSEGRSRSDRRVRPVDYEPYDDDDGTYFDEFHGPSGSAPLLNGSYGPGHSIGRWGKSFFIGGEYLLVRPHFSDSTAFIRNEATQNGNDFTFNEQSVDFDYGYRSQFRGYLGFRLDQCQSELRFTFWNMNFNTTAPAQQAVPAIPAGQVIPPITFVNNIDTAADNPGDVISANSSLNLNVYDIDFSKRVTFNKVPCGSNCGDPCFVPCPGWDMQFTLGVRVADVNRAYGSQILDAQGAQNSIGQVEGKFVGAGPRVGILGRRFFGRRGTWYVYGNGAGSLLLGNYERNISRFTVDNGVTLLTTSNGDQTRTIPVAEIEVGVAYQPNRWVNLSAGWLFQAWWDLGAYEAADASFIALDDSNIMSFDGLTIRGEITF